MNKTLAKVMLLCIALAIACFVLQGRFGGKTEYISRDDLPEYGSAEQDTADGYVTLQAVSMTYICDATDTTKFSGKGGGTTLNNYHSLYLVEDSNGNTLVYDDASDSPVRAVSGGMSDKFASDKMPIRLYGRLGNVEKKFTEYDDYDWTLSEYGRYDLVSGLEYLQVSRYVQSEDDRIVQTVLQYGGIAFAAAGALLLVLNKRKKKNTEEGPEQES